MENSTIIVFALVLIALGFVRRYLSAAKAAPPETIRSHLDRGSLLVDVRSPEEFAADHYPEARNIPLTLIAQRTGELGGREDPLVLYCNTGRRSALALGQLRKLGFRNAVNAGGLERLRAIP